MTAIAWRCIRQTIARPNHRATQAQTRQAGKEKPLRPVSHCDGAQRLIARAIREARMARMAQADTDRPKASRLVRPNGGTQREQSTATFITPSAWLSNRL